MNFKSYLVFVAAGSLALTACSGNSKRIPILKNLNNGQGLSKASNHSDDSLQPVVSGECLDLKSLSAALDQKGEAFLLYTTNLDLGTSTDKTRKDFASLSDDILRGQAIKSSSLKVQTKGSKPLSDASTLGGLLAIKTQEACDSVTFANASGADSTWSVQDKAPDMIILANSTTQEVRHYSFSNNGELSIITYVPTIKNCQDKNSADIYVVQREALTISWDGRLNDGLNIPTTFIQAIAKHITVPPAFNVEASSTGSNTDPKSIPQSVVVPQAQFELLKAVVDDGNFSGITCTK